MATLNIENMKNFFTGKKILVTGHTGFKGGWLSKILIELGAEVTGLSLPPREDSFFKSMNSGGLASVHGSRPLGDPYPLFSVPPS